MRYRNILVGIDFSQHTPIALESATRIADLVGAERLHVVNVAKRFDWPGPVTLDDGSSVSWERLIELAHEELLELPMPPCSAAITRETRCGVVAQELIASATSISADMIIVATQALGPWKRAILGSVASSLIRAAHCPVMIVSEDRRLVAPPKRIVAAIDLSPISEDVVGHADSFAQLTHGHLTVASACDFDSSLEKRFGPKRPTIEQLPYIYRTAVVSLARRVTGDDRPARIEIGDGASPSNLILETIAEQHADLVVLGTSGHNAWQRMLLGSTATRVVREASCPVLVIPYDPASAAASR